MSNIFTLDNVDDFSEKLNIDELYERKRQHDLNQVALFNKILNRVHVRIKNTSKQNKDDHFCWFLVPEFIIGVPRYDQADCIAYIMDKLRTNGFLVKYVDPNLLMICWNHYVPSYVRNELKRKTGIVVDEYGTRKDGGGGDAGGGPGGSGGPGGGGGGGGAGAGGSNKHDDNAGLFSYPESATPAAARRRDNAGSTASGSSSSSSKTYNPISSYKPTGDFMASLSFK